MLYFPCRFYPEVRLQGLTPFGRICEGNVFLFFVCHLLFGIWLLRALASRGAVVQLGERLNGIQEVRGSTPLGSTKVWLFGGNLRPAD